MGKTYSATNKLNKNESVHRSLREPVSQQIMERAALLQDFNPYAANNSIVQTPNELLALQQVIGNRRLQYVMTQRDDGHDLTDAVVQHRYHQSTLARQTVEQYQTKGSPLDPSEMGKWSARDYWEQQVWSIFEVQPDRHFTDAPKEERNAVYSALWQNKPKKPIRGEISQVVSIPKRKNAPTSKDLIYKFTFQPRKSQKDRDPVTVEFVSGGSVVSLDATNPPDSFTPMNISYTDFNFPEGSDKKYWKSHPEEYQHVFDQIKKVTKGNFDQVIATSVTVTKGKQSTTKKASFSIKGKKEASGEISDLAITFLGSMLPSTHTPSSDYASKDYADLQIEEVQTGSGQKKSDKLGAITGLTNIPVDEKLAVKFAIWQYFKTGTRNAEVDAIVPIAETGKTVLYTFRFQTSTNNVDVQRIREETKAVNLNSPQLSITRVIGFAENSKDEKSLTAWLRKRYPKITVSGKSVKEIEENANKVLQANAGTPIWFKDNYGIEILDASDGSDRLQNAHNYKMNQVVNMKKFTTSELTLLESIFQTMSNQILAILKGVYLIRQEISIEGNRPISSRTGLSLFRGSERTVIIFDSATMNDTALFLGGKTGNTTTAKPASAMTFAHELGHIISWQPGFQKDFDNFVTKNKIKPITWYAGSSPKTELYPEAFALYQLDPEWMKNNWPKLYGWFDTLAKTGKPPVVESTAKKQKP